MPKQTPLFTLHQELAGKIVTFASYLLPIQYKTGLIAEHLHTRKSASLFDVSHMGQITISGDVDRVLSRVILTDFSKLQIGSGKYSVITNEQGGIVDDCIVARDKEQEIHIVLNASRKKIAIELLQGLLPTSCILTQHSKLVLVALQGPKAELALSKFFPQVTSLAFMSAIWASYKNYQFRISRTGYTGEDGFEVSMPAEISITFCKLLLALQEGELVKPAGLGARDSLRLEAGLALYGQDLTEQISPIEAGLLWTIPRSLRETGNFNGAEKILQQISEKPHKKFVGLRPVGRVPVRQGTTLYSTDTQILGEVTSGGFSPSLQTPIAMGYVSIEHTKVGSKVIANVRGKDICCEVIKLPFIKHNRKK